MSFVFPALLVATVFAGIPVLLHLILRQKPKSLPFPAFRFLVAKHQTNRRTLKLRQWLLLALRMLLIAGLILAIARPRLLQDNLGLSSERPVAAVFVIDVSASMDARSSDNRTRLDDAKKRALELLDELPAGSRIAVLSSSDVRGDWMANPFQARQRIQNFKLDAASPPLPRATMAAFRLLTDVATRREDEAGTRLPRLLCVFSDTTRGSWTAAQTPQVLEASDLVSLARETLLEAKSEFGPILEKAKNDVGPLKDLLPELRDALPKLTPGDFPLSGRSLQLVQQTRSALRDVLKSFDGLPQDEARDAYAAKLRRLLGRLSGYQTIWFDVGLDPPRDLAILDIDWPLAPSGAKQLSVPPGGKILLTPVLQALGQDFQATLTAKDAKETREVKLGSRLPVPIEIDTAAQKFGPGFHSLEFAVNVRDIFTADNQRYATIAVHPPRKVLVIASSPLDANDEVARALKVHRVAVDVSLHTAVEAGIPAGYDAVFLYDVVQPSDKLWKALGAYVRAGGGLAIIPGTDDMKASAYRTESAREVLPGDYVQPVWLHKSGDKKVGTIWDWQAKDIFRHPLLRPFERWIRDGGIDFVVSPPRVNAFWATKPLPKSAVLATYLDADQSPAVLERSLGAGKVLQFTTPFKLPREEDESWNEYAKNSFCFILIDYVVKHLAGELETVRVNFDLGREEASLPARLFNGRGALKLTGPETGTVTIDDKSPRVSFPQATQPGNYQVLDKDKKVVAAFSVNLPSEEIDLTQWPVADIENLFGANVRVPSDRQANLRQLLQGRLTEPIELFPILMVALLVLLALENLLANRFYRKTEDPV